MSTLRVSPDRPSYPERRRIRQAALRMGAEISGQFPDVTVTVDLEMADGEDAFVWIRSSKGTRPVGLARLAERLARRQARTTGYWIVPRIISTEVDSRPVLRLRPRLFQQPRPLIL